jgi:hypothetical protein
MNRGYVVYQLTKLFWEMLTMLKNYSYAVDSYAETKENNKKFFDFEARFKSIMKEIKKQ